MSSAVTAPRVLTVVGLVLVVGGVALALLVPPADWFATLEGQAPLRSDTAVSTVVMPEGNLVMLGSVQLIGYGAALLGLLLLAVATGYALARRSTT